MNATWTESVAVRNKAQVHVFAAIKRARRFLPFPLPSIDADKEQLRETYRLLDLVSLRAQIDDVQEMLLQTVTTP